MFLIFKQKFVLVTMLGRSDCVLRLKIKTTENKRHFFTNKMVKDVIIKVECHSIPSTIIDQDHDHGTIDIDNDKLTPLLDGKLGYFNISIQI